MKDNEGHKHCSNPCQRISRFRRKCCLPSTHSPTSLATIYHILTHSLTTTITTHNTHHACWPVGCLQWYARRRSQHTALDSSRQVSVLPSSPSTGTLGYHAAEMKTFVIIRRRHFLTFYSLYHAQRTVTHCKHSSSITEQ